MDKNKNKTEQAITEIKKEICKKINETGYQEYRLAQQETLKQFVEQFGWVTINGDKLLENAEGKGE